MTSSHRMNTPSVLFHKISKLQAKSPDRGDILVAVGVTHCKILNIFH